jgi:ankyrin repeat protein
MEHHHSLEACREMCLFLVEKGANPDQLTHVGKASLYHAILSNNQDAVLLLLKCGANANQHYLHYLNDGEDRYAYPLDQAILKGNPAIVSSLLVHGAVLNNGLMALAGLGVDEQKTRDSKLEICRLVWHHHDFYGNNPNATAVAFDRFAAGLESAIAVPDHDDGETFKILFCMLFEVGMDPTLPLIFAIKQGKESIFQWLIRDYRVDPFVEKYGFMPFVVAARHNRIATLDFFLDHWDEKYESNRYRNSDGDKPEDFLLRDPRVSLKAFTHVVERYYFEDTACRLARDFVNTHGMNFMHELL